MPKSASSVWCSLQVQAFPFKRNTSSHIIHICKFICFIHEILLTKLGNYGIHGVAYKWFKSYLENRRQKCFVNGSLSKNCSLRCGIPQGIILGALLFLIFISDLPNCLSNSHPRMYADDTNLTYSANDI